MSACANSGPNRRRIGRYYVLGDLGAGSMGWVVRAFDPQLDRDVALKFMARSSELDRGVLRARFLAEARSMAQLHHENVVRVYDVAALGKCLYIAMELVQGQTLRDWLAAPRTWREVVSVFIQAGKGLMAAHAEGLVHRDFKPANVLISRDGVAKVMDFGLALTMESGRESVTAEMTAEDGSHEDLPIRMCL